MFVNGINLTKRGLLTANSRKHQLKLIPRKWTAECTICLSVYILSSDFTEMHKMMTTAVDSISLSMIPMHSIPHKTKTTSTAYRECHPGWFDSAFRGTVYRTAKKNLNRPAVSVLRCSAQKVACFGRINKRDNFSFESKYVYRREDSVYNKWTDSVSVSVVPCQVANY